MVQVKKYIFKKSFFKELESGPNKAAAETSGVYHKSTFSNDVELKSVNVQQVCEAPGQTATSPCHTGL